LEVNLTEPGLIDAIDSEIKTRVLDPSESICLRIQIGIWEFAPNSTMKELLSTGWDQTLVSVTASQKIQDLVEAVRNEVTNQGGGSYNAIHVRRGDHGLQNCNGALNALVTMLRLGDLNPDTKSFPWLLMSDGEPEFYDELLRLAGLNNLTIVPEGALHTVAPLKDDFSRYLALECAYSSAAVAINTFKYGASMRCQAGSLPVSKSKKTLLCR